MDAEILPQLRDGAATKNVGVQVLFVCRSKSIHLKLLLQCDEEVKLLVEPVGVLSKSKPEEKGKLGCQVGTPVVEYVQDLFDTVLFHDLFMC